MDRRTPRLIDRRDLLAALDRAAAGKVTIISAPAGSGKTSLLRAWADRPGQRHRLAVLQVQRDQHDAQQFWLALLGAVRRASPAGPPAATPDFNGRAMVDRVLSELLEQARAALEALDGDQASPGEIRNARAVVHLAEGDPAGALAALAGVVDGTAPVVGYVTVVEAHLLAGLAHRRLGDQRAANRAAERALALAETDRLVLPFAMTGSGELLKALPRHETAHAALIADILDVMRGASLRAQDQSVPLLAEELSPGELRVLRYLPTNLSRPEIASELSVSVNTVNTHVRNIYAKLGVGDRNAAVQRARELRLLSAGLTRY